MRKNSHYNKRHHLQRRHHQHPTQRPPRPPIPTLYQLDPQLPITHQPRQPTRRDPSYPHQLVPRLLVRTSPPQHRPLPRLRSTLHRRHFLQHHMSPHGLHLRPRRRLALVHQRRRLQLHPPLRSTPTTLNRDHRRTKGALKAITTTWPTTKIQRCLVHVKRNVQKHVTLRPVLNSPKSTPGSLLETAESHHTRTSRRLAQTPPGVLPHLRGLA